MHLQQLFGNMRSRGTAIGTSVVIGVGTGPGVVMKHTGKKPAMKLIKEWAMRMLHRMGYTTRKANSKCKILPDNFEEIKSNFLADVRAVVEMEGCPSEFCHQLGSHCYKDCSLESVDNGKKEERG